MLTAKEIKEIATVNQISNNSLEQLIMAAQTNHLNYVFIDKNLITPDQQNDLRELGYGVVVGYGDVARIKIYW